MPNRGIRAAAAALTEEVAERRSMAMAEETAAGGSYRCHMCAVAVSTLAAEGEGDQVPLLPQWLPRGDADGPQRRHRRCRSGRRQHGL
ncbi:hypothetical protein GUJ93_ZPchr0006g44547 [Zizania palustris]|uniref:Uncharacterized protein n=1 Tax=Zizania palustris TaxID=103762 RepID=A0A8J5SJ45_ZIZPA|nr:hypothetical protein GUJ93_ZPchr0006g44547 [Zizania palustris]